MKKTKKKAIKPSKSLKKLDKCLCDCHKPAISRGLCWNHYMQARYKVMKGKTTWRKLENKGEARKKGGAQ